MTSDQPALFPLDEEEKLPVEPAAEPPATQPASEPIVELGKAQAEEPAGEAIDEPLEMPEPTQLGLSPRSSLREASEAFYGHMVRQGFSDNTIKAFQADLRLFTKHAGGGRPIGKFAPAELEEFMNWLRMERGVPCSPKSYARRLTTLKVFFAWLAASEVIDSDPAAPLVHQHPTTPLPEILYDEQVNALLRATRDLLWASKPDSRPYLLVSLVLQTGIKKGECMEIKLEHIDLSSPQAPVLYVRYADPRKTLKERKLALGPTFYAAYGQYLREYQPKEFVFECTARNLEYVLEDAASLAGIKGGVSFEQLRWTCAVRDYRNGMPAELLRQKMGLSGITWRETLPKIQKLARPAL